MRPIATRLRADEDACPEPVEGGRKLYRSNGKKRRRLAPLYNARPRAQRLRALFVLES